MSMPPPLPPPPEGWGPPRQPDAPDPSRPAWRQGRPGWALLHLAIGLGIWFVGLIVVGIVLAASGRTETELDTALDDNGGAFLLFLLGAIAGWILFAYTDGSLARRWGVFLCLTGGSWLLALVVVLAST
jgi:hypothetical protein